jgi:hypothetical protein
MNIEIELKQTELSPDNVKCKKPPIKIPFKIALNELENAIADCYLGLGTPYDPIPIDNFVSVGENAFSLLSQKTKISICLDAEEGDDLSRILDYNLVCCKVINVGKKFINLDDDLMSNWNKIFKYKDEFVFAAPDGTLYISPNAKSKCVISTKEPVFENNVSYSILISLKMKIKDEPARKYYLILDPLVKISSSGGTNPGGGG